MSVLPNWGLPGRDRLEPPDAPADGPDGQPHGRQGPNGIVAADDVPPGRAPGTAAPGVAASGDIATGKLSSVVQPEGWWWSGQRGMRAWSSPSQYRGRIVPVRCFTLTGPAPPAR